MAGIFAYKCSSCDKVHEGSPSFAFNAPWYYQQLPDQERTQAELTTDTCIITHSGSTERFIRVVLEIPIHGVSDPFLWGVWVSLSEQNYQHYLETWWEPDANTCFFGWFANRLPCYPDTLGLKSMVHLRPDGNRPYLDLERNGHPLVEHLYTGMSIQQAQEIAEHIMHSN